MSQVKSFMDFMNEQDSAGTRKQRLLDELPGLSENQEKALLRWMEITFISGFGSGFHACLADKEYNPENPVNSILSRDKSVYLMISAKDRATKFREEFLAKWSDLND